MDNIPPITKLTINQPKYVDSEGKIYVTPDTTFTLTAQDNKGGSGVAYTLYRIFNETFNTGWITYTKPFNLTGLTEGLYLIEYYSVDNVGNTEKPNTTQVTLFRWNYIFKDTWNRGTTLKINLKHKFFEFQCKDKDFGIKADPNMYIGTSCISIKYYDNELKLYMYAIIDNDYCTAQAQDRITNKGYLLYDKPGIEN